MRARSKKSDAGSIPSIQVVILCLVFSTGLFFYLRPLGKTITALSLGKETDTTKVKKIILRFPIPIIIVTLIAYDEAGFLSDTINQSIHKIKTNVDCESDFVNETSSAMVEMVSNIQSVTAHTSDAHELSLTLVESVRSGEIALKDAKNAKASAMQGILGGFKL